MLNEKDVREALRSTLPDYSEKTISDFVRLLVHIATYGSAPTSLGQISQSEVQDILRELAGKDVVSTSAVLSFGDNSQTGDIHIRDIAGGDVYKFEVNLFVQTGKDLVSQESSPQPEIEVVSSKPELIEVIVVITNTGMQNRVLLPQDALVKHVIPVLAQKLNLPRKFDNGWDVPYYLYNDTQSSTLVESLTFRENNVHSEDVLLFQVQMTAG